MPTNMLEGKPYRAILSFAFPMLLGNLFQQAYSLADMLIVGRYIDADALAAVGSTASVVFLLTSVASGLSNGAGIVVAQYHGARIYDRLARALVSFAYIVAGLIVVITVAGLLASGWILGLLKVPVELLPDSLAYLRTVFAGIFGKLLYNAFASVLRSMGDSRTPLFILIVSCAVNIGLDILFIAGFGMGVGGAALATVIAEGISAALCLWRLIALRGHLLPGIRSVPPVPSGAELKNIARAGLPTALQSSLVALGGMSVQGLVNSYGAAAMAAYAAASRIDALTIQIIVSLATALSVFTGQNRGDGNVARIELAWKQTLRIMLGVSAALALAVLAFREPLMRLFLDRDAAAEAIRIGSEYLAIIGIAYVIAGVMNTCLGVIRGAGDVNVSVTAGLVELGARVAFAFLLAAVLGMGVTGIWLATPISWGCGCVVAVLRYASGKWKQKGFV